MIMKLDFVGKKLLLSIYRAESDTMRPEAHRKYVFDNTLSIEATKVAKLDRTRRRRVPPDRASTSRKLAQSQVPRLCIRTVTLPFLIFPLSLVLCGRAMKARSDDRVERKQHRLERRCHIVRMLMSVVGAAECESQIMREKSIHRGFFSRIQQSRAD